MKQDQMIPYQKTALEFYGKLLDKAYNDPNLRTIAIDSVSEVWQSSIQAHLTCERVNCARLRSNFWIKTRKMPNGLIKTYYQSKRFTALTFTVKTLSQWS